jgi:hypothetical protein
VTVAARRCAIDDEGAIDRVRASIESRCDRFGISIDIGEGRRVDTTTEGLGVES